MGLSNNKDNNKATRTSVTLNLMFSQVTFLLTEDPNYTMKSIMRRRKRRAEPLTADRFSLYSALSSSSGGLTIFTSNSDIHSVSAIVEDNTAAEKVR